MIRRLPWLLLTAVVLALDWWSKAWVLANLAGYQTRVIVPRFFSLSLNFNPGAIFGSLGGVPPVLRGILFAVAGVAAVLYFGWEFLKDGTPALQRIALGCILGGALGNGLDRWRHGAVVDFLDFQFFGWHYWTFNVADSFIVCGGILLGVCVLRAARRQAPAVESDQG